MDNDLDLYPLYNVGDVVWYVDNDDPTDHGKVTEVVAGNFHPGAAAGAPYHVLWADGQEGDYHPSQIAHVITV